MATKKSRVRKTRTAITSSSATKPAKKTPVANKSATTPSRLGAKPKTTAIKPLKQAASTPAEAVHAGLEDLRSRLWARQTTAPRDAADRGADAGTATELDAVLARLAADYARVLGRA